MNGSENVRIHELQRCGLIRRRFQDWTRWKLLLPLIMLLIFYPIYIYRKAGGDSVLDAFLGEPFLTAFAHGDLLLFSALLLFEVSVEANHIQHELGKHSSEAFQGMIEWPRIMGIILIVIYGAMKLAAKHEATPPSPDWMKVVAYCLFCLSATVLAVAFSIYAFWRTLEQVLEKLQ